MKSRILLLLLSVLGENVIAQHEGHDMSKEKEIPKTEMPSKEETTNVKSKKHLHGKRVEYNLYINDTIIDYVSTKREAMAINGNVPGPTLYFTEGDTAIIYVHNKMKHETSIHWHGILLPNEEDGVPYLTTAAIKEGKTHKFIFPLIQSGTYWYHSHTSLQEQAGVYGSIVIYPRGYNKKTERVVMLSDWTNEKPSEVLRSLKRANDWYAIKKNSVQSWGEALVKGHLKDRFITEWKRMPAMDVSDVYYDKFLLNGKNKNKDEEIKPGETLRLRIINGGASSYFWLQYAGGKMKIVAADGLDVEPVMVDKMMIAIAETYDIEVVVPNDGMSYEFRATAQDITGYASLFLGKGMEMKAPDLPKLDYFAMMRMMNEMDMNHSNMNMDGSGMDGMDMNMGDQKKNMKGHEGMNMNDKDQKKEGNKMQGHDMKDMKMGDMKKPDTTNAKDEKMSMGHDMEKMSVDKQQGGGKEEITFTYDMLRAPKPTTLSKDNPVREINLSLTGNMIRYVWSFDNKTLSQSDKIKIKKGENVRMILTNSTMMRHPLHLHGHFFRFVNEQGEYSPMKHTFDIPAMGTVTIEFFASEEKDWFFHCHVLYHMMAGMARVISYENSPPNTQVTPKDQMKLFHEDRMWSLWGTTKVASDAVFGNINYSNNQNIISSTYRVGYKNKYEFQPDYQRFIDRRQFLSLYAGADIRNTFQITEGDKKIDRRVAVVGTRYLLPLFVLAELRVDHKGDVRFQLTRNDMPITRNLRLSLVANTDWEYNIDFDYFIHKYISIHASYDSDYKYGAGLTFLW
ncbi:MAG: multicopper oxidase domain-containing protein [Cyclobacteriaceae bacterium]